jgi:hypothetical protein
MGKGGWGPLLPLLLLLALLLPLLFPAPLPGVYAQSEIKFRGVVWTEPNEPYDIDVRIDEVLLDPEGRLSSGSLAHVDIAEDPSRCACDWPLHRGDRVEVYARHYWYGYGDYAVGVWIYSRDHPYDGYIIRITANTVTVTIYTTTTRTITSTLHATATTETTTYTTVSQTTYSTSTRTWYTTVTKIVTTTVTSWTTVTTMVPAQASYEWGVGGSVILATLIPLVFSAYAMRGRKLNLSGGDNKE